MGIKKLRMDKYVRKVLMVATGMVSIAGVILMVKEYRSEHVEEQKKVVYEYSIKEDVNYIVHLKPNILYEEETLNEGQMYLTEFIDYIAVNFISAFEGSEEVNIKENYKVSAEIRGYTTKEEEKQIVWRKELELAPEEVFAQTTEKQDLKKEVKVNFPEYNEFAKSVLEASKVNIDVEVVVKLFGNKTLSIPGGGIDDEVRLAISVPLNKGYFSITKEGIQDKHDKVEETIKIPIAIDQKRIVAYGGLIGIGIIGICLLGIGSCSFNREDLRKRKIKKIINNHGSRMVVVACIKIAEDLEVYHVNTIEDLIKIADEIEKPVFYEQQEELVDIKKFYVKDQELIYIYEIKEDKKQADSEIKEDSEGAIEEEAEDTKVEREEKREREKE